MTNKQTEEVIKEFRKQFTLDPARVFFGDPEELRKQGWEVGKSRLIINQSATPEEIEAFILTAIKEAEERGRKDAENITKRISKDAENILSK